MADPSPFHLASPFPDSTKIDPRLSKFGLYASQSIKLNDRTQLKPWWIATGNLDLGYANQLVANAVVFGNVGLRRPTMWGDLMYGSLLTTQEAVGKSVLGTVTKAPASEFVGLPCQVVLPNSVGTASISVEPDKSMALAPGNYGVVAVKSRATLTLEGGDYVTKGFQLEPGAKVVVNFNGKPLRVWALSSLMFKNSVTFTLNGGDAGDILWLYPGTAAVHYAGLIGRNPLVGDDEGIPGTLVAPNADVSLASNVRIWGAIWAKSIEIHQDNKFCEFIPYDGDPTTADADGDGLSNVDELRIGTDYLDPDTDNDGYNDGLEYWGRGIEENRMGAVQGLSAAAPSWGYFLDMNRKEFFNPLRRDAFLRLYWQPSSEGSDFSWMRDLELTAAIAKNWENPDNFYKVLDSSVARLRTNTWVLHVDAGDGYVTNLPPDFVSQGGPRISAVRGNGLYFFDTDGQTDGDNEELYNMTGTILKGLPKESFPDIFVHGYGVDSGGNDARTWSIVVRNGKFDTIYSEVPGGMANPFNGFFWAKSDINPVLNWVRVIHEFGHCFGLKHPAGQGVGSFNYFHQGVMNYEFTFGQFVCTMAKYRQPGGSFDDSHWCGEHPEPVGIVDSVDHPRNGLPYYMNFTDPNFHATVEKWIDPPGATGKWYYDNGPIAKTDRVFVNRHGNVDRKTGFHRGTKDAPPLEDIGYSTGRLCSFITSKMDEKKGVALCKDRNGILLREPEILNAIDWNMDGVIDPSPVNLLAIDTMNVWVKYFRKRPSVVQADAERNEWEQLKISKPRSRDGLGSGWAARVFSDTDAVNGVPPMGIISDGRSLTHAFEIP